MEGVSRKTENKETIAKKAPTNLWSTVKDIRISKFFGKSKTQTNEKFSHYCNSRVESLRLSALISKNFNKAIFLTLDGVASLVTNTDTFCLSSL